MKLPCTLCIYPYLCSFCAMGLSFLSTIIINKKSKKNINKIILLICLICFILSSYYIFNKQKFVDNCDKCKSNSEIGGNIFISTLTIGFCIIKIVFF